MREACEWPLSRPTEQRKVNKRNGCVARSGLSLCSANANVHGAGLRASLGSEIHPMTPCDDRKHRPRERRGSGFGVVSEWFRNGFGVVSEWFRSGFGMVREWFGSGSGVVREWFGVVREWFGSGSEWFWKSVEQF